MQSKNTPPTPPTDRMKTWIQQTFNPEYFKRVAFALLLCLVIYMLYLVNKGVSVDLGALAVFVLMSFLTQLFFSTPQKNKLY